MSASTPSFSSSATVSCGTVQTANTNRDGTGTITTLLTGVAGGTRIERIRAKAGVTTTAGMLRFYLFNAAGTFVQLFDELLVTAITASSTVKTWEGELQYGSLRFFVVPENFTLRASTAIGEVFTIGVYTTA